MKTDGTRVMTDNLNMNSRSKNYVNSYRRMKAHMLLMLILSIQLSTIIINKQLLIIRSMLMIDEISLLEVQIWKTHLYTLRAKVGGLVMKMISQGLNSLIKTFISSVKKPMK